MTEDVCGFSATPWGVVVGDGDVGGAWPHQPVLLSEVVEALALREGLTVLDATVGMGGHAAAIAARLGAAGTLICLDRDPSALEVVQRRLVGFATRVELRHASYSAMRSVLDDLGIHAVDRVLMDLGVGSYQLDDPSRGMSFRSDGPLDMRFDPTTGTTARDLLRKTPEAELGRWFREYGEERFWKRIARAIVRERRDGTLPATSGGLADLVAGAVPPAARKRRLHPATRVFQALRIVTNRELEALEEGLEASLLSLRDEGRLAVIAFHSLEDRRVKHFMRERMQPLFKKPVGAGSEEQRANPRSRSAKLRVAVRAADSDPLVDHQEAT